MTTRDGRIWFDGWAGRISFPVFVIGETSKRYRVRAKTEDGYGQRRWKAGAVFLAPKLSVTFDPPDGTPCVKPGG